MTQNQRKLKAVTFAMSVNIAFLFFSTAFLAFEGDHLPALLYGLAVIASLFLVTHANSVFRHMAAIG